MKTLNRIAAISFSILLLAFLAFYLTHLRTRMELPWKGFKAPDDVLVARKDLARRYTGNGYFHFVEDTGNLSYPFITTANAHLQIPRIVNFRQTREATCISQNACGRGQAESLWSIPSKTGLPRPLRLERPPHFGDRSGADFSE